MNRFVPACLFLLALAGAGPAAGQAAPRAPDLRTLSHSLETVAAKVGPTVVQIRVTAYGPVPAAPPVRGPCLAVNAAPGRGSS